MAVEVIVNAAGGSFDESETENGVREAFEQAGIEINLRLCQPGTDPTKLATDAIETDPEIIVAGGGDGTVSAVAAVAARAGKPLGIIPLGTLNHFSRDLNIPADIPEAAKVVRTRHTENVDLAEVNGRTFINNSSIGLYPSIVRSREKQQHRLGRGKWSAAFFAAMRVLRVHPFLHLKIRTEDREIVRKTPFIFVGNNEYAMDLYNIGKRDSIRDGKLCVYILHRGGRWGMFVLIIKTLFGRLEQAREFESLTTTELTIDTGRRKKLLVARDGEVESMSSPLEYRIRPGGLKVIVPADGSAP